MIKVLNTKQKIQEIKEKYLQGRKVNEEHLDDLVYFQDSLTDKTLAIYNKKTGQLKLY